MTTAKIDRLTSDQKAALMELWNREYPVNLSFADLSDFDNYLSGLQDVNHIILLDLQSNFRGWYFDFMRNEEHWFAVILHSGVQGKGHGKYLIEQAKSTCNELNGWVIDHNRDVKASGMPYNSPLQFYLSNGFQCLKDVRLETEKISAVKIRWRR